MFGTRDSAQEGFEDCYRSLVIFLPDMDVANTWIAIKGPSTVPWGAMDMTPVQAERCHRQRPSALLQISSYFQLESNNKWLDFHVRYDFTLSSYFHYIYLEKEID